jgi:hypothetical protein
VERAGSGSWYLQDSELVHVLVPARGDHVLENTKLLVHLGAPPPLNQTVCRLARNLASSSGCASGWLAFRPSGPCRGLCVAGFCVWLGRVLDILWLHLDDFARAGGWRRQRVVIFSDDCLLGSGAGALAAVARFLCGHGRGGRRRAIGRVGSCLGRPGRAGDAAAAGQGCRGECKASLEVGSSYTTLSSDVCRRCRCWRHVGGHGAGAGAHRVVFGAGTNSKRFDGHKFKEKRSTRGARGIAFLSRTVSRA